MAETIPAATRRRYEFHEKLVAVPGVKKVYFQPPSTVKLQYPCIIYHRDGGKTEFGDNQPYHFTRRYSVMVVDPNPDSEIPDFIANHFPMCYPGQHFTADNLNHDTFTIYY